METDVQTNKNQLERVTNLLPQARADLGTIVFRPPRQSAADSFTATLAANVDNDRMTDAEFRQFVRNSLPAIEFTFPTERQVVLTNIGEAYCVGGYWFKWWGDAGGSKMAIKNQESITEWKYVEGFPIAP